MMKEKMALTVKELEETLGIGRSMAYELVARPDFPTVRLGRKILIPVAGLQAWLAHGGTDQQDA